MIIRTINASIQPFGLVFLCAAIFVTSSSVAEDVTAALFTAPSEARLVDSNATPETKALFLSLSTLSASGNVLFGHQEDLAYGVFWQDQPGRSDVKEVAGSYPAVYGWDVGGLELGHESNIDGVNFDSMREWIKQGYRRGGVITISWHMYNLVTGGDFYDTTPAVSEIIPGGRLHDRYRFGLDRLADFMSSLKVVGAAWNPDEHLVPVIFRPFHEHNRSAFWWGKRYTTDADYIKLWRFTVEYLRDVKQIHNLLYAFSPDHKGIRHPHAATFTSDYLFRYPGDEYVDVFGLDNYEAFRTPSSWLADFQDARGKLVALARARGKLPAITETGQETVPDSKYWTGFLAPAVGGQNTVAWVLVWRNASETHFYAPYPGHPSVDDFRQFFARSNILFESELPVLYR